MKLIKILRGISYILCCTAAISASATSYVSESNGGANQSATGGIDLDYLTTNYEIHRGYDIGQEIVSLLLPDAVEDVVNGLGEKVVSYVKGKLIDGAQEAYNVDVSSLVDAMTPMYDQNSVVAKSRGDVSTHGILSVIRKFSFQNALMYFNVVMLSVAGLLISGTFFRSMWAMMTVSDDNASYKRLIMMIPSVAIALFALLPTSNGLSGGQMVLLTAFLTSNYIGSVLVTIPSLFFPMISVENVFNAMSSQGGEDPIFAQIAIGARADVNIAAKNMFFAESVVESMLDDGLLDATLKGQALHGAADAGFEEYNADFAHQGSVFVGGANISYTNEYIQHKADEANTSMGGISVIEIFRRSPLCFTSKNWDLLYLNKECQAWFRLSKMSSLLHGSNRTDFNNGMGKAFYDTVKARVVEMKKVVCSEMDASQRASSFVCQIKDDNGFTGRQYGDTKPDLEAIKVFSSFKTSPLYSALKKQYDDDLAKLAKGHSRSLGGEQDLKAQVYIRGIISTPYQILTQMMDDDGKNLVRNAKDTTATHMLRQLSDLVHGMASIDTLRFVDYVDVGMGEGRLYSKFACAQNADYCNAPTPEQNISKNLIAFTKFNDIFYSVVSGSISIEQSASKSSGAGGVFNALFPSERKNTQCLEKMGRGCMPSGQTPLSTPRQDGMNWMVGGLTGWIAGETLESLGKLVKPLPVVEDVIAPKMIGVGGYIKTVSNVALAIGTGLCYLGTFIYIALTMKMYFRCVVRLLVTLLAQPVVAVAFMLNGFNEIRTDTENMTASRFFAQSVVRMLVDCVCLSVAILVSLTLVLFAQGIMSVVSRIFVLSIIGSSNIVGGNWMVNILFQLSFPFIMSWCIWKCANLVPYLFEKVGDFVEERTGVQMQDNHNVVADFKRMMKPKAMYGG
ncbi:hypothetical protein [Photobacterium damselae]|uniref:hypothetical protein n=1 Tax=Photobacterium damselae TaxID=38293 RepID=UPI001F294184|nr:hypothetical protein [Photobacterium damselae]UKA04523.1 hypothetical protein IHC89_23155 [Photobacterium damselae subsp. damselae]